MLSRLETTIDHLGSLRRGLVTAVKGYNDFVGSFDSRVMVQARRMQELGVASATDLEPPEEVSEALREARSEVPSTKKRAVGGRRDSGNAST